IESRSPFRGRPEISGRPNRSGNRQEGKARQEKMITWFITNLCLALLALGFDALNRDAPPRSRFLVLFIALCGWAVPWQLATGLLPAGSNEALLAFESWQLPGTMRPYLDEPGTGKAFG